jgi:hypothetical protein
MIEGAKAEFDYISYFSVDLARLKEKLLYKIDLNMVSDP